MAYVFRGGIYFSDNKKTQNAKTERIDPPKRLRIPMLQSNGRAAVPTVDIGAHVLRGDIIGSPVNEDSIPVHSPVSGTVAEVGETVMPDGRRTVFVDIANDMQYTLSTAVEKCEKKLSECDPDEIIDAVRSSGVCEPDGTPSHLLIKNASGNAEYCIVNCVFDEPYVSGEYRIALENPAAVINGLKIILKALKLRRGIIAVGDTKPELLRKLNALSRKDKLVTVTPVRAKYPAGGQRELLYSVTGCELGEGKTPLDSGAVIFSAASAANIFAAFASGVPYTSRAVTVGGSAVAETKNIMAPIGTPFSDLVAFAGGTVREPSLIIAGGPMTGCECDSLEHFVTKTTSALLLFTEKDTDGYSEPAACIRCGRCISVCPMRLVPSELYKLSLEEKYAKAVRNGALLCHECGACAYVCPGKVPITEYIRRVKLDAAESETEVNAE